jgi:acyl dehydratase
MGNWNVQRHWEDVRLGDQIPSIEFPLTVYRLAVAVGATRDFNSIHYNVNAARASGAPDIYANTMFLMGMWERTVREFIGTQGVIRRISGFRLRVFTVVGDTVKVRGEVTDRRHEGDIGVLDLTMRSENSRGITVGPGVVTVTLPLREEPEIAV